MEQNRSDLLKESRFLNIVIPSTSYIVVENSAQWRILERKEAQSLNAESTLDFDEKQTPEPGIILLILLIIYIIIFNKRAGMFCKSADGHQSIPAPANME